MASPSGSTAMSGAKADATRTNAGTHGMRGSQKNTKLSVKDQFNILSDYMNGMRQFDIAKKYNLLPSAVSKIINDENKYNNLDKLLLRWFCQMRDAKATITKPLLLQKAKELALQLKEKVEPCQSWIHSWCRLHSISFDSLRFESNQAVGNPSRPQLNVAVTPGPSHSQNQNQTTDKLLNKIYIFTDYLNGLKEPQIAKKYNMCPAAVKRLLAQILKDEADSAPVGYGNRKRARRSANDNAVEVVDDDDCVIVEELPELIEIKDDDDEATTISAPKPDGLKRQISTPALSCPSSLLPELIEIKDDDDEATKPPAKPDGLKRQATTPAPSCPPSFKIQKVETLSIKNKEEKCPVAEKGTQYSEDSNAAKLPSRVQSYADALRMIKPLCEFALIKKNYRAIGLLTQVEKVFERSTHQTHQTPAPTTERKRVLKIKFLELVMLEYVERAAFHYVELNNQMLQDMMLKVTTAIAVPNFNDTSRSSWLKRFYERYKLVTFSPVELRRQFSFPKPKGKGLHHVEIINYVRHRDLWKKDINKEQALLRHQAKVEARKAEAAAVGKITIANQADATKYIKALQEYTMFKVNFNAVDLLIEAESAFTSPPKRTDFEVA